MFVRVDEEVVEQEITGFSFIESDGNEAKIYLGEGGWIGPSVKIATGDGYLQGGYDECWVAVEDLPKLIKSLQAAYDHIQKGK